MAMDNNPRRLTLNVTSVDVDLNLIDGTDVVKLVFHGKLLPSTKKRITKAVMDKKLVIEEKTLA